MNFDELLPFYVLDALSNEENAWMEQYLIDNPAAQQQVIAMQADLAIIPDSVEPMVPTASVKQQLFERIDQHPRALDFASQNTTDLTHTATQSSQPSAWDRVKAWLTQPAFAGVAAAVATIAIIWSFSLNGQLNRLKADNAQAQAMLIELQTSNVQLATEIAELNDANAELAATNETLLETNNALQTELDQRDLKFAIYSDPNQTFVDVPATEASTTQAANGLLTVASDKRAAVFTATDLQPLAEGLTYQLWVADSTGTVSAGLFSVDESGAGTLYVENTALEDIQAVGLSIEPEGGSEQPTGDIVLHN